MVASAPAVTPVGKTGLELLVLNDNVPLPMLAGAV